jgi:cold shock CspA family protein
MQTGTISQLVHDREYGKIKTENGEEAHFHKGCLWNTKFAELIEGQDVEFEMQPSYKGHLAFQIRPFVEK